ncbi:MAG: hypothetical protein AAGF11_44680 [Myxococcota bacterium]
MLMSLGGCAGDSVLGASSSIIEDIEICVGSDRIGSDLSLTQGQRPTPSDSFFRVAEAWPTNVLNMRIASSLAFARPTPPGFSRRQSTSNDFISTTHDAVEPRVQQ